MRIQNGFKEVNPIRKNFSTGFTEKNFKILRRRGIKIWG